MEESYHPIYPAPGTGEANSMDNQRCVEKCVQGKIARCREASSVCMACPRTWDQDSVLGSSNTPFGVCVCVYAGTWYACICVCTRVCAFYVCARICVHIEMCVQLSTCCLVVHAQTFLAEGDLQALKVHKL